MQVINHLQSHAFIVNKLRATYSSICPGLTNKIDSIYISFPWFRFTLMDRAQSTLPSIPNSIRQDVKTDLFCCDWN